MLAIIFIPVFFALAAYLYYRLMKWLFACSAFFRKKPVMIIIAVVMFILTANIYLSYPISHSELGRFLKRIAYSWIIICLYALILAAITDLIRVIVLKIRKKQGKGDFKRSVKVFTGIACAVLLIPILTYGFINARIIRTTTYDIDINKDGGEFDDLNVVLIADLHMGFNIGCSHMRDMVRAVNDLDPDLVLVAGDIFDNDYDSLEDDGQLISILREMHSKYGVYAVYGNHDIDEGILAGFTFGSADEKVSDPRMDKFIEDCGWVMLTDEGVMINDSVYLFGRPDYKKPGRGVSVRLTPEEIMSKADDDTPVIILEHEPVELAELAAAGADVQVAGHTHAGQFFPLTISNSIIWENGYGYLNKNGLHSIVTSGVGLFGPYFRLGTIAEVMQIRMHFAD